MSTDSALEAARAEQQAARDAHRRLSMSTSIHNTALYAAELVRDSFDADDALISLLEVRLHATERELASARAANERVSSMNVCHYCARQFNGWNTADEHAADCPVLAAQAVLAASAIPPTDDAADAAAGEG